MFEELLLSGKQQSRNKQVRSNHRGNNLGITLICIEFSDHNTYNKHIDYNFSSINNYLYNYKMKILYMTFRYFIKNNKYLLKAYR